MKKNEKYIFLIIYLILLGLGLPFIPENIFLGIRIEYYLFGIILLGLILFHEFSFQIALSGLIGIVIFKFSHYDDFNLFLHIFGQESLLKQFIDPSVHSGEWHILLNLFGLLVGFSILAKYFSLTEIPEFLSASLPGSWKGPFIILLIVFILSSFLDNIAGAMIGATMAIAVYGNRVHPGYMIAIVASANAGGAGSVIGDTTTTMMWLQGIDAFSLLPAYIGAIPAFLFFAFIASFQQIKRNKGIRTNSPMYMIQWNYIFVTVFTLVMAIVANILIDFPAAGVWLSILICSIFIPFPFHEARQSFRGAIFLMSLVLSASLMPVEVLPKATKESTFIIGLLSSVFDNIPLTKLALIQGGYDWAMLAFAVGYGGSMTWFGSSAGVAVSNIYPGIKSLPRWILSGWHVIVAYCIAIIIMNILWGWHPSEIIK